jgi:hypothetical protein
VPFWAKQGPKSSPTYTYMKVSFRPGSTEIEIRLRCLYPHIQHYYSAASRFPFSRAVSLVTWDTPGDAQAKVESYDQVMWCDGFDEIEVTS